MAWNPVKARATSRIQKNLRFKPGKPLRKTKFTMSRRVGSKRDSRSSEDGCDQLNDLFLRATISTPIWDASSDEEESDGVRLQMFSGEKKSHAGCVRPIPVAPCRRRR
mmetsp:Transcript_3384/g.6628  ORF Transcript_3384/g.6628 Transcript_3384/m.6628 type:complete len:108 (-) Transcript_3384:195-518(-)